MCNTMYLEGLNNDTTDYNVMIHPIPNGEYGYRAFLKEEYFFLKFWLLFFGRGNEEEKHHIAVISCSHIFFMCYFYNTKYKKQIDVHFLGSPVFSP